MIAAIYWHYDWFIFGAIPILKDSGLTSPLCLVDSILGSKYYYCSANYFELQALHNLCLLLSDEPPDSGSATWADRIKIDTSIWNVPHFNCLPTTISISVNMGKPICEEVHWIIIRLSTIMSSYDIAKYTGVGWWKIDQVLETFKQHGTVDIRKNLKPHTHRNLCDKDIEVCSRTKCIRFCRWFHGLIVSASKSEWDTWFISRWATCRPGDPAGEICFNINCLESTSKSRFYDEEGVSWFWCNSYNWKLLTSK